MPTWAADEIMSVVAARLLRDGMSCFVGIGIPSTVANLARNTHAPNLFLIYEAGALGAKPYRLPLSIGDGELAVTADSVVSVPEIFNYWLQGGHIDVGYLSAAQIDRFGNLNTTVIGPDYHDPKVRLPGAGGAPEIAAHCLGTGRSSRLYDRLVRRRIAKSSTCHLLPLTSGATLFLAVATGFAETPADDLEAALAGELDEAGDLDADEVARSVVGAETRNLRGLQQLEWRADLLSMYATHFGDAGRLNRDLRRLRRVTVDEVREWSRNYLRPGNRAVVRYLPEAPS